ncbi:UDP-N-acetylmuramoyl-tripeptide--D-alanyl-D-alanine ligase [Vibrio sp.]|nr:UDP-N-acetylmuramoyl-tripeptide--D-alanyl-D-alanine ligase [Vibrio sp.]
MITVTLLELANVLNAELIGQDQRVSQATTDTRAIQSGDLFIALVGDRFDAHEFLHQAEEQGAAAVVVNQACASLSIPQLVVANTTKALGDLGAWVHQQCNTKTLAITGSCGKTTVKEMVANILNYQGQVLYTAGNFNNDIGVPLTLLRTTPQDDFSVIELGANHIGEIAYTTQLVKPSVALVNNVAAAHLEGFGSIDGVKQAKGEIYQGLDVGDTAIVNLDSHGDAFWEQTLQDKTIKTFSMSDDNADYYPSDIALAEDGSSHFTLNTPHSQFSVQLNIVGQHNIGNALAAAALSLEFGATDEHIQKGLNQLGNVKGRVEVITLKRHIRLIDDSYNASVPAMLAAVDLLANYTGRRWLVLGFMAELGSESHQLHKVVAEHAKQYNFEEVLTFGDDTQIISELCHGQHFHSHEKMLDYITQTLNNDTSTRDTIIVKGANSAGMSQVASALKETYS